MKFPPAPTAPPMEFSNAKGSTVPKEYAIEARKNPDVIPEMAETPSELKSLQKEALVRQYVLLVDMSGSMKLPDGIMKTRWDSARKVVTKIIDTVFEYDTDGRVPVYLFDDQVEFLGECTNSSHVKGVFESHKPRGTTDLAQCLDIAMKTYSGKNRPDYSIVPGTTYIVVLDGNTDDNEAVKNIIRHYADPASGYIENHTQIGISFVQIGSDPGATRFLQDLDDGIEGVPDIVDTKKDSFVMKKGGTDKLLFDAIFD